jgi:hypothetical protein
MKYILIAVFSLSCLLIGCGSNSAQINQEEKVRLQINFSDGLETTIVCPGENCPLSTQVYLTPEFCDGTNCEAARPPEAELWLTEDPPPGLSCTEIYGGPETVNVSGTVKGRQVEFTRTRADGCQIYQYDLWKEIAGLK